MILTATVVVAIAALVLVFVALTVVTGVLLAFGADRPARPGLPSAVSERWLIDTFYTHGKSGDL